MTVNLPVRAGAPPPPYPGPVYPGPVYPGAAFFPRHAGAAGPERVMVYCHDLFGLGNVSRMLSFCRQLQAAFPEAGFLFITGSSAVQSFELPERFEYIKLPEISRSVDGVISARVLPQPTDRVVKLRAAMIAEAAAVYEPDLVVIDKKPLGALDELAPTLEVLDERGDVRRVLLLRDILDSPDRTRRMFAETGFVAGAEAHIDQILVVGERKIFDVADKYALPPAVAAKLRYCGYLEPSEPRRGRDCALKALGLSASRPTMLVTAGGGEDGAGLIELTLAAGDDALRDLQMVIVCGPRLPAPAAEAAQRAALDRGRLRVLPSSNDLPQLMSHADVVVSMAGYNTVCEIMASGTPAVLVPRDLPGEEQLVRARALAGRGLAAALAPGAGPADLAAAVRDRLTRPAWTSAGFFSSVGSSARIAAALGELFPRCAEAAA